MIRSFSPYIISASRATDIPGLFGKWFISRLKTGFFFKRNPYNGELYRIDLKNHELFVFWTKNIDPFFEHLDYLDEYFPNYYFQYTLNNYDGNIERNLPDIELRINSFIRLSERIGKDKVIWRFDPLLLSDKINIRQLLKKIEFVAEKVQHHTNKLVFSFIDINNYNKIKNRLKKLKINLFELSLKEKLQVAEQLKIIKEKYNLEIASCAEDINLLKFGITRNKCIDDDLIKKLFPNNKKLISFISEKRNTKDKGQRKACKCILSKDIGQYNTCIHSCVYCYANVSYISALKNYNIHLSKPYKESIV